MPKKTKSMVIRVPASEGKKVIALWNYINSELRKKGVRTKISQPEAYEAFKLKESGKIAVIRHQGKQVVV